MRALLAGMFLVTAWPLAAAEVRGAASLAAPLENQGVDARTLGMGSALMGLGGGSESLLWNPAGLSRLKGGELSLHHHGWVADIFQESLAAAYQTRHLGGLGLGLGYIGFGSFESRDSQGKLLGSFEARRLNLSAGWGRRFMPQLALGLGARYNRQDMGDAAFNGYAVDLGAIYEPRAGLSLALAYANAGATDLGSTTAAGLRLGAAYDVDLGQGSRFLAAASTQIEPGGVSKVQLGIESALERRYFLRAGYQVKMADNQLGGLQGFTAGLGLELGQARLDYAWLPYGELGVSHRLSLSYKFAQAEPKPQAQPAKAKASSPPKSNSLAR